MRNDPPSEGLPACEKESQHFSKGKDQKGMILVVGVLFLSIIALLTLMAMTMVASDLRFSSNSKSRLQASYLAEAGINEAFFRINLLYTDKRYIGEKPGVSPNPHWRCRIVTTSPAQPVDVITLQADTPDKCAYTVSISYKIESRAFHNGIDNDEVVFYGQDFGYRGDAPLTGKNPVVILESVATVNGISRTLIAEVTRLSITPQIPAALCIRKAVTLETNTFISGLDHVAATDSLRDFPSRTDAGNNMLMLHDNLIDNHGGREEHFFSGIVIDQDTQLAEYQAEEHLDSSQADDELDIPYGACVSPGKLGITGLSSSENVVLGGSFGGSIYGDSQWKAEAIPFDTLETILGVSDRMDDWQRMLDKADLTNDDLRSSGASNYLDRSPEGITYLTSGDKAVVRFARNTEGWGLLYVRGNLSVRNLTFKGLIYVEGDLILDDRFWLLGGLAADGFGGERVGGGTVLYSSEALAVNVGHAMKYIILSYADKRLITGD